jgi:hypothetical protein
MFALCAAVTMHMIFLYTESCLWCAHCLLSECRAAVSLLVALLRAHILSLLVKDVTYSSATLLVITNASASRFVSADANLEKDLVNLQASTA